MNGGFGPNTSRIPGGWDAWALEEGGTKQGRKPLLPHLVDDHGGDPDRVYSRIGRALADHEALHRGERVPGYSVDRIRGLG